MRMCDERPGELMVSGKEVHNTGTVQRLGNAGGYALVSGSERVSDSH